MRAGVWRKIVFPNSSPTFIVLSFCGARQKPRKTISGNHRVFVFARVRSRIQTHNLRREMLTSITRIYIYILRENKLRFRSYYFYAVAHNNVCAATNYRQKPTNRVVRPTHVFRFVWVTRCSRFVDASRGVSQIIKTVRTRESINTVSVFSFFSKNTRTKTFVKINRRRRSVFEVGTAFIYSRRVVFLIKDVINIVRNV